MEEDMFNLLLLGGTDIPLRNVAEHFKFESTTFNDFFRLQLRSRYYELTGIAAHQNGEAGNIVQNMAARLQKLYGQNIVRLEEDPIHYNHTIKVVRQAGNAGEKPNRGEQEENMLSVASLKSLLDGYNIDRRAYHAIALYLCGRSLPGLIDYLHEAPACGPAFWKAALREEGIRSGNDWPAIRESVRDFLIRNPAENEMYYLGADEKNWLDQLMNGQMPDTHSITRPFFNTLSTYCRIRCQDRITNARELKEKYDEIRRQCETSVQKLQQLLDHEDSPKLRQRYEQDIRMLQEAQKKIFIGEYKASFTGKRISSRDKTYLIKEFLHEGDFWVVWKAEAINTQLMVSEGTVALKMLRPSRNITYGKQVINGIAIQKYLAGQCTAQHWGIVDIPDGPFEAADSGFLFFTMQFIDGINLREWLETHKDREDFFERFRSDIFINGLCEIIQFLHAHGVQHLDICPENLLIDPSGKLYLTDFDNAQRKGAQLVSDYAFHEMTSDGAYSLPAVDIYKAEQAEEDIPARQADIYSCTRIFIHAFLLAENLAEGWEGNVHNNKFLLEGRFEPYRKELVDTLSKGLHAHHASGFAGITEFREMILEKGHIRKKWWNKQNSRKMRWMTAGIVLASFLIALIAGYRAYNTTMELNSVLKSKHQTFGLFYTATSLEEWRKIPDFETHLFQSDTFKNRLTKLQEALKTETDSIFPDPTLRYDNELFAGGRQLQNCKTYIQVDRQYLYCFEYGMLTPTFHDRSRLDVASFEHKGKKIFSKLHRLIMDSSPGSSELEVPDRFSDILGYNRSSILKPTLIYAVFEDADTQDSIMYRYPFYSKDFSDYDYPARPWYSALRNKQQYAPLDELNETSGTSWKIGFTEPYGDYKAGFLPIRTLFCEYRAGSRRWILLIDFIHEL